MMNRDVKHYLREVGKWLPCSGMQKKRILDNLRDSVAAYVNDNPVAEYHTIVDRFGTPQVIASTYIDELDTPEILENLRIKRTVVRIVSATAAAIVFIWLGVAGVALISNNHQVNGYYIAYIDEGVGG